MTDKEHNQMLDKIVEEVINSFNAETANKYYLPEATIAEYKRDMDDMISFLNNLRCN